MTFGKSLMFYELSYGVIFFQKLYTLFFILPLTCNVVETLGFPSAQIQSFFGSYCVFRVGGAE